MMINTSLDKDSPHHPNLFPEVKGYQCLILTCLIFLMFFQTSTAVLKPPLSLAGITVSLVFCVVTLYAGQKKMMDLDVHIAFPL